MSLCSLETFEKNQQRLNSSAKAPARKNINQDFPLRGFILCDDCQQPLTACWSKGRTKTYPYYLCHAPSCVSYGKSIKREELEGAFDALLRSMTPSQELFAITQKMFGKLWHFRAEYQKKRADTLKIQRIQIERKTEKLIDLIVDASSPTITASYEKRMNGLEQDKLVLDERIAKCGRPIKDYDARLRTALNFLENPYKLWASERLEDFSPSNNQMVPGEDLNTSNNLLFFIIIIFKLYL